MDERIAKVLRSINDFERLAQFEVNLRRQNALTDEVAPASTASTANSSRWLMA